MSDEPSILAIDPTWRRGIEDMGSKPKFWFRYQDEMWLFKQARPNTGEHWAEKIASEIAGLLKLPTHEVRIACFEGHMGCAVKSFLKKQEVLVHGNELLAGAIKGYDKNKQRGQADHHFRNIVHTIEKWFPGEKFAEQGFGAEQLAEMQKIIDAEKSDLFDVLSYVAYASPPVTREERAEHARESIHDQFNPKQQAFLDFVLSHYISVGVEELDMAKLAPLLRLKYHDSIPDAVADLGDPASISEVFSGFQKLLYVPAA